MKKFLEYMFTPPGCVRKEDATNFQFWRAALTNTAGQALLAFVIYDNINWLLHDKTETHPLSSDITSSTKENRDLYDSVDWLLNDYDVPPQAEPFEPDFTRKYDDMSNLDRHQRIGGYDHDDHV